MKLSQEIQQVNQGLVQKLPHGSPSKQLLNLVAKGSKGEIYNEMCRFREKGEPNHLAVIQNVPVTERLPALAKMYGNDKIAGVLSIAITNALNNFNLRVGMNPEQIANLAYELINESEQDQLALQDIMLFLDGLPKFKYGKVYDRMDMPTFFEMLEIYREQRHQAYVNAKEESHAQFKAMGDSNRMSNDIDKEANRNAMNEYLKTQYK
jgi:hypothetical protein